MVSNAVRQRPPSRPDGKKPFVAIVDYGMGNLFSVKQACEYAGLPAAITASKEEVLRADGVILPGVGAFGDAMETLRQLDLASPLREIAHSGVPLMGICLGMQLMMSESFEFGQHQGLNLFQGKVIRFEKPRDGARVLKVPEVGWNIIYPADNRSRALWDFSPLRGVPDQAYMYFVHSFYCVPEDPKSRVSLSRYGHIEFCSSVKAGNIFACQFHPERSGPCGLQVYCNFAAMVYNRISYD